MHQGRINVLLAVAGMALLLAVVANYRVAEAAIITVKHYC